MKSCIKILLLISIILYFFIFCSKESEVKSPWQIVTEGEYDSCLHSIYFLDSNNGWACGDNNTILNYKDGKWSKFQIPEFSNYFSFVDYSDIFFLSENDGWVVGRGFFATHGVQGIIYHWNGTEWEDMSPPLSENVYSLDTVLFITPDEGWVGGVDVIYHYINNQWIRYEVEMNIYSFWFNSQNEGYACGSYEDIYYWDGNEWYPYIGFGFYSYSKSIVFTSPNEGWVIGVNAGSGEIPSVSRIYYFCPISTGTGPYIKEYGAYVTSLESLSFSNPYDGWAVGSNSSYHWDGNKWDDIPLPDDSYIYLNDVFAISPDDVWAVGENGTILHFTGWK